MDRYRTNGHIVLRLPDHALLVSGELRSSGDLACLCDRRPGSKVPAARTAQCHTLGRRGLHLFWSDADVGGFDAAIALLAKPAHFFARYRLCGCAGAVGVLSFWRLGGLAFL